MTPEKYQEEVLRTVVDCDTYDQLMTLAALGMAGETGEVVDLVKKHLFNKRGLNEEKIRDEVGDVLWYISVLLSTLHLTFEDVMDYNIAKLQKRHQHGFTPHYTSDSQKEEN